MKSVIRLKERQGFYCEICEAYIMNPMMILADCVERSSLLWMRRIRGRGRPPGCGTHHQGVAGQGNISDLNQITCIKHILGIPFQGGTADEFNLAFP